MKRNKEQLEERIIKARNIRSKAIAYYNLAVFHDNNAREAKAIPNYLNALKFGMESKIKAKCLAWLASSLYKTNKPKAGLQRCREAMKINKDKKLQKLLIGLKKRIQKAL